MTFKKAVKRDAKLRLALCGPAGSGKTYSLLSIATELGGPIAYVDTEHGSASKYADLFHFDVIEPETFDPRQLIECIGEAAAAGYKVICIDSLSHYWMGKGGELEMVDSAAKRTQGNSFAAWKHVTPVHNQLIDTIISAPIHVLVSMRTKTEWVIEKDDRGKSTPRKIGLAPVMRDGIEFEFDVCGDLDQDNTLTVTKSRCPELANQVINRPGKQVAIVLKKWLAGAPALVNQQDNPTNNDGGRSSTRPVATAPATEQGQTATREGPERREIPTPPARAMNGKVPTAAEQVPPQLMELVEKAKDRASIEQAIFDLVKALGERLGDEAALGEYSRLLGRHGAAKWQDLGTLNKARAFIRDLWLFLQRVPEPPKAGFQASDDDLPSTLFDTADTAPAAEVAA